MKCHRRTCRLDATHRVRVRFLSGRTLDETLCHGHAAAAYYHLLEQPQTASGSLTPLAERIRGRARRRAA